MFEAGEIAQILSTGIANVCPMAQSCSALRLVDVTFRQRFPELLFACTPNGIDESSRLVEWLRGGNGRVSTERCREKKPIVIVGLWEEREVCSRIEEEIVPVRKS